MIHKGYSETPYGQIHWRSQGERRSTPDLYCLHPAPFSGLAFTTILPHLSEDRRVIAPDYPGHGGSDPFKYDPTIHEYADAILAVINRLSGDKPVDLLGFHSGCLIAAELAVMAPDRIRTIALIDAPAFDADTRRRYLPAMGTPFEITPQINCLTKAWDLGMTKRVASQGLDRSFEMFAEQLRHGRGLNAAFHAAFSYDVEAQFAKVTVNTHIIATKSGLLEPTRRAARLISGSNLIERLDIGRSVLDEHALKISEQIRSIT